jgi:hypothetical protein
MVAANSYLHKAQTDKLSNSNQFLKRGGALPFIIKVEANDYNLWLTRSSRNRGQTRYQKKKGEKHNREAANQKTSN